MPVPNMDFTIAAMRFLCGWPDATALSLFALARSAGWIAHGAERIGDNSVIRPRVRYVGRL